MHPKCSPAATAVHQDTKCFHTWQSFVLSGQTFLRTSCLSAGPVGPPAYMHSSPNHKHSWIGSSSGYSSSPQWPMKESQLTGSLMQCVRAYSVRVYVCVCVDLPTYTEL